MKVLCLLIGIGVVVSLVTGCAPSSTLESAGKSSAGSKSTARREVAVDDALVQFSLLAPLAAGDYAGGVPLRSVLAGGDFGVGTFDRLDGEMIVLDGAIYQALADSSVRAADLGDTTPFAAVTFFDADGRLDDLAAASLDELDSQLDGKLPHRNLPYALRIEGEFAELTLRSVPAQSAPFEPLVEVVKQQVTWEHRQVRGTMIGLRCPAWIGTLNVPGYHWHFLSDDHKIGGHVLACRFERGSLNYDECTSLVVQLPQSKAFDEFDEDAVDEQDIDRIERQRPRAEK